MAFDKKKLFIGAAVVVAIGALVGLVFWFLNKDSSAASNCLENYQVFKSSCVPLSIVESIFSSELTTVTIQKQDALLEFMQSIGLTFEKEESLVDPGITDDQMAQVADFLVSSELFPEIQASNVFVSVNKPLEAGSNARFSFAALAASSLADEGFTTSLLEQLDVDRVLVPISAYPCLKKCKNTTFLGSTQPPQGTQEPL